MMKEYYSIKVVLVSGEEFEFKNLDFEQKYLFNTHILDISIKNEKSIDIQIKLKTKSDQIKSVEYKFVLEMKNYSKVIAPDSGRWFLKNTSLIDFWKNCKEFSSNIGDIKLPLFMFLKDDCYVGSAVGIIGVNLETEFKVLEPESNRALNVHTGHITLEIARGNDYYPLGINEYRENLFYYHAVDKDQKSWMSVQRDFSELQREIYGIKEQFLRNALEPMWCSWVDWDSKDISTDMLLTNVKAGVELGIKNFIIDDGWYGNGLDSDYMTDMDIGDWEPDPKKIPDMKALVNQAHQLGARLFIWCAPHAVAQKSQAFQKNYDFLIADENGKAIINEPQYYSYCFQCPQAREIMSDICAKLIEKWGFDGSKYDLFNWVPNVPCKNPNHKHDVNSMIKGFEKTLELIHKKTKQIKPEHMVELKQNYGTIFNMRYGNLMRAGDSPFDLETNYQRTLHIQSYTSYALNDYQTFTANDTQENVACIIIKMLAAGVPSYGMNFDKLSCDVKKVVKYYNNLYSYNLDSFRNNRIPLDPNYKVMFMNGLETDYIFLLSQSKLAEFEKDTLIFNGSYKKKVFLKNKKKANYFAVIKDCTGVVVNKKSYQNDLEEVEIPIGGNIQILYEQ